MASQITTTEATEAARRFVSDNKNRQFWTLSTIEGAMPNGWILSDAATDDAFYPVNVKNVAASIRRYAVRR